MAKTHIMRFAPQDYRTSRTRARSVATRDPMLRLVYLEALFALYEAGGSLPADPAVLCDELGLAAKDIARCLPILDEIARAGSGRGGILIEDGRVTNGRVSTDLEVAKGFSVEQAGRGRKGGEAKAASVRLASARASENPSGQPTPNPQPTPKPEPTPNPQPAATDAGGETSDILRAQATAQKALDLTALETGRPPDELLVEASTTPRGQALVRIDTCASIAWLRTTEHRLTAIRLRASANARDRPPQPSPRAQDRQDQANAMIRGGLIDRGELGRGNEIAAGDDARPGHDPADARAARPALPPGPRSSDR